MRLTFYAKDSLKSYTIAPSYGKNPKTLWIDTQEGEGGDFDADEVSDVIFKALDKYFKENH